MNAMTHTGNFDFSFESAVAAAVLDAEIAAYKAEHARPDYIFYSLGHNGFVFGDATTVYQSYTAADAARAPQPTPMPTPDEIDDGDGYSEHVQADADALFN